LIKFYIAFEVKKRLKLCECDPTDGSKMIQNIHIHISQNRSVSSPILIRDL